MLSKRVLAHFLVAPFVVVFLTMSAFAQLETDPLPPEPPIDLGGRITTPDQSLLELPTIDYSRSMRARQMSVNEPVLRTTVTVEPTFDAPPSLEAWNTTPLSSDEVTQSKAIKSESTLNDGAVSQASHEMPAPPTIGSVSRNVASHASGFSSPIAHPTSVATPLAAPPTYAPHVEHIPSVGYGDYGQSLPSVSQPIQAASYGSGTCDSSSGCSCGGCYGGGGSGGGILGGGCLAGYGQANALPLGAAMNGYFDQQIYNGERARFTVYNYDFSDLGSADPAQLNRAGRTKLAKLATPSGARSFVAHQIVVQPVLDNQSLSQARRAAVVQFLSSRLGLDYGDSQVILAEPDYRGLRGVEAIEIDRNQLQNTRSFGGLGAGSQAGGGQGGGGQGGGGQIGGGSQIGQR